MKRVVLELHAIEFDKLGPVFVIAGRPKYIGEPFKFGAFLLIGPQLRVADVVVLLLSCCISMSICDI